MSVHRFALLVLASGTGCVGELTTTETAAPVSLPAECKLSDSSLTLPVADSVVLIGTLFDHSLTSNMDRVNAVDLAFAEGSAADPDRDYVAVHCDAQQTEFKTRDEVTVELSRFLAVELDVSVLIGPTSSSQSEIVYDAFADQQDLLIVAPSSSSPRLIEIDGTTSTETAPGLFWRTVAPDSDQARAIATDMRTVFDPTQQSAFRTAASTNVAVVAEIGPYGEGIADAFSTEFEDQGGTATVFLHATSQERTEALQAIDAGDFDEVLFLSTDAILTSNFLAEAATMPHLAQMPMFLTEAARNSDLFATSWDSLLPNVRGSSLAPATGPVFDRFRTDYAQAYPATPDVRGFMPQAYDAAWLVIYAHATADDITSGTSLARAMRHLSEGSAIEVGPASWDDAVAALAVGQSIDVVGTSGPLDFDAASGETSSPKVIWTVEAGEFVNVAELP